MRGEGLKRIEKIKSDHFYLKCLSLNSLRVISETVGLERFAGDERLSGPGQAEEVICAAGLLHDIGRWRQYDNGEDHALAGAGMAGEVLERAGFSGHEIKVITRAIREHRREAPGSSRLGRVLCLADDLSRPCKTCGARMDCYKFDQLENLKEKVDKLRLMESGI